MGTYYLCAEPSPSGLWEVFIRGEEFSTKLYSFKIGEKFDNSTQAVNAYQRRQLEQIEAQVAERKYNEKFFHATRRK